MAERRMFAKTIIDSDAFLDMPMSTQCLYFHLSMRADDEGFLNNPKKIQRMVGASEDDLRILLSKRFILAFESGVIVIKHWKLHNYIQKDRYKPTVYQEERAMLEEKDNGSYTYRTQDVSMLDTECIQDVSKMDSQVSIGKDRLGKDSTGEGNACASRTATQIADEVMEHWRIDLAAAVRDWLAYKKEKRQGYKEVGLRALLSQIRKAADTYGEDAVIEIIHNSMASGYQGITLDRLQEKNKRPAKAATSSPQKALSSEEWEKVMARL